MSLHDDALASLRSWNPPDASQEAWQFMYVELLTERTDAVYRASLPDHLTAGTLVISETGRDVLLNLHGKAQRWFAFGGHCEPGDATLAGAALREAEEESGLRDLRFDPVPVQLSPHPVPFCHPSGTVTHFDVRYAAVAARTDLPVVSAESLAVRWFSIDDLPDLDDDMHELIALARARLGLRI